MGKRQLKNITKVIIIIKGFKKFIRSVLKFILFVKIYLSGKVVKCIFYFRLNFINNLDVNAIDELIVFKT